MIKGFLKGFAFSLALIALCFESYAQIIGPYLQSPTDTSVWITWKTSSGTESTVVFGTDSLSLSGETDGECQILTDEGYEGNYYYHSVQLTGLEAASFYYYRVSTETQESKIYRFRTQPSPGNTPGIYRFLIFGDHQVTSDDRYPRLLRAAREKLFEKYGGQIEEHINLILNDGDQVDAGTLNQYENVHLKPSSELSGNIAFMTTVGNHETYGSTGLPLYYSHFLYDKLGYKNIPSPGGENYYSYQQKNIVFIHLSSEHPEALQTEWVRQIVDSAKSDTSVGWIITIAHRPIQAEQFVGDISVYMRDQIIPILAQTEKAVLHITGHHHLYARGQVRDHPIYHIISGGGSWDQYWGQSDAEKDFDDVQKTIDYWTYQIVTIDPAEDILTVESYAIGSPRLGFAFDNILIDSFSRKPGGVPPDKPRIITVPQDTLILPYTFISSGYSTVTNEPYNSVQFQISGRADFSNYRVDLIRDYENLYGTTGPPDYKPVDIHKDVDIFRYPIGSNELPNGGYFVRTRHRDRNLEWSEWSDPVYFAVKGSTFSDPVPPLLTLNKAGYNPGEEIQVGYSQAPARINDWIGIYRVSDIPGQTPSLRWSYTTGSGGELSFAGLPSGYYFIAYFLENGYAEAGERTVFSIGSDLALLSVDKPAYSMGQTITVNYSNGPGTSKDWVGILKKNASPGTAPLVARQFIVNQHTGSLSFNEELDPGEYYAALFINNSGVRISNKAEFIVESVTVIGKKTDTDDFELFPIPSNGWFKIKSRHQGSNQLSVIISSLEGKQVLSSQYDLTKGSDIEFNLSSFPRGFYIVTLNTGDGSCYKKLILQ